MQLIEWNRPQTVRQQIQLTSHKMTLTLGDLNRRYSLQVEKNEKLIEKIMSSLENQANSTSLVTVLTRVANQTAAWDEVLRRLARRIDNLFVLFTDDPDVSRPIISLMESVTNAEDLYENLKEETEKYTNDEEAGLSLLVDELSKKLNKSFSREERWRLTRFFQLTFSRSTR